MTDIHHTIYRRSIPDIVGNCFGGRYNDFGTQLILLDDNRMAISKDVRKVFENIWDQMFWPEFFG